jgi:hypothetical protein
VSLKLKLSGKTLASKTITIAGGKTATVKLQLSSGALRQLVSRGRLKVSAVAKATDAAGNRKTVQSRITLHL